MRDPDHVSLIPLVELSLAIMRLSCERFFSLVAVRMGGAPPAALALGAVTGESVSPPLVLKPHPTLPQSSHQPPPLPNSPLPNPP